MGVSHLSAPSFHPAFHPGDLVRKQLHDQVDYRLAVPVVRGNINARGEDIALTVKLEDWRARLAAGCINPREHLLLPGSLMVHVRRLHDHALALPKIVSLNLAPSFSRIADDMAIERLLGGRQHGDGAVACASLFTSIGLELQQPNVVPEVPVPRPPRVCYRALDPIRPERPAVARARVNCIRDVPVLSFVAVDAVRGGEHPVWGNESAGAVKAASGWPTNPTGVGAEHVYDRSIWPLCCLGASDLAALVNADDAERTPEKTGEGASAPARTRALRRGGPPLLYGV